MAVRLVIRDEVNIKLENLSLDVRKKLAATFKYEIPYAKYQPAYKLGRWDGMVSLFGLGGNGYISQVETILDILTKMGVHLDEVDDQRKPINLQFEKVTETYWADQGKVWPPGHPAEGQPIMLRDYQVVAINRFLENPQSLQEIATGAGKCQPLHSLVLTSTGWKTMGDIKIGDLVVTPTGKLSKVINVFEPGVKDIYQLTFSDGRTAKSCKDHLWRVHNIDWRTQAGHWRNISTEELIKLKSNTKRSIGIPLVSMRDNDKDVDLPMDPWLLGFLLGDGSFRNGRINFSTSDSELVKKVESKLNNSYKVKHLGKYDYAIQFADLNEMRTSHSELMKIKSRNKNGHIINNNPTSLNEYRQIINELGLGETYSHNKFIPKMYFNSSFNQRIEIIRGLVDSDGTVDKSSVGFTSVSKQLALDFQQLIWSVGGIAKITTKEKNTYNYNNEKKFGKTSYRVSTKYITPWELISLQRKIDKTNLFYQYGSTLKLKIEHIEKIGSEEVKCILIDDPEHLYITDNYIVTHNTITTATLSQVCERFGRTITIVPNKSLVEQTEEDFINCGLDVGVYYGDRKDLYKTHTICTWQSLNILDKKSKNQEHDIITLAEFLNDVKAVIVDEAHMAKAEILRSLLTQNLCNAPIRWGLTGTIPKEKYEYEQILASIGPVVGGIKAHELQELGVLSQCQVKITQLIDLPEFKSYPDEVKYLVTNDERMKYISALINDISKTGNTLVLVNRIESGKFITNEIENSVFIHGTVKTSARKSEYDEIKTSDNKLIVATYGVAAVGINIPRIFNLVLLEPGKSFTRVIQSIGRGIRKAKDKDFVQVWDITSTCKFAKRHLTDRKRFYKEAKYQFTVDKIDWNK